MTTPQPAGDGTFEGERGIRPGRSRLTPTVVDVLVIPGCGDIDLALKRVHAAVESHGGDWVVRIRQIDDPVASRFLGCPSVRVDERDVELGATTRLDYVLRCREYLVEGRIEHAPPVEWIIRALALVSSPLSETA